MKHPKSWGTHLNWVAYTKGQSVDFKERINPIDGKYHFSEKTIVAETTLPFYTNEVKLICIADKGWKKGLEIYFLTFKNTMFRLKGTSPPLHEVNAKAPVQLNVENVKDYLRFFCYFVHGPFLITESLQQAEIPEIKDDKEREEFLFNMHPIKFNGMDKKNFLLTSTVWYKNALFTARFCVQPTGMLDMIEDEPLLEELSIQFPFSIY